jgi:serine/threonine protein kinase
LCRSLSFLEKNGLIHCDLKPENVLIEDSKDRLRIKLSDLGSSMFTRDQHLFRQPLYIQSRFYRSPEILIGAAATKGSRVRSSKATTKIDMWSLGCLLAEMYLNKDMYKS